MKPRILVVDDDEAITQQLYLDARRRLRRGDGQRHEDSHSSRDFLQTDISILDLQMPPDNDAPTIGLQLLSLSRVTCRIREC
jgi:hypothetical protein